MAIRRMISLEIIDSDAFLEMPSSTQSLYFHIVGRADDDGFCDSPLKIIKICNSSIDDLKILVSKRFLIDCPNGVVVVKHWWLMNTKRKDRYKPSNYLKDNQLYLDDNNAYTTEHTQKPYSISWQPNGNQAVTQDKISKDKIS